jgi:hypothetical protein
MPTESLVGKAALARPQLPPRPTENHGHYKRGHGTHSPVYLMATAQKSPVPPATRREWERVELAAKPEIGENSLVEFCSSTLEVSDRQACSRGL